MRTVLSTSLTLLALLLSACGGSGGGDTGDPNGPAVGSERSSQSVQSAESVSAADTDQVLEAEDAINTRCRLVENQEGSDMPVSEAIRIMAEVYKLNPEGVFAAGVSTKPRTMRTIIEENAAKLRDCGDPSDADKLERVLEA